MLFSTGRAVHVQVGGMQNQFKGEKHLDRAGAVWCRSGEEGEQHGSLFKRRKRGVE